MDLFFLIFENLNSAGLKNTKFNCSGLTKNELSVMDFHYTNANCEPAGLKSIFSD